MKEFESKEKIELIQIFESLQHQGIRLDFWNEKLINIFSFQENELPIAINFNLYSSKEEYDNKSNKILELEKEISKIKKLFNEFLEELDKIPEYYKTLEDNKEDNLEYFTKLIERKHSDCITSCNKKVEELIHLNCDSFVKSDGKCGKEVFIKNSLSMVNSILFQPDYIPLEGDFREELIIKKRQIINKIFSTWNPNIFVEKFEKGLIEAFNSI